MENLSKKSDDALKLNERKRSCVEIREVGDAMALLSGCQTPVKLFLITSSITIGCAGEDWLLVPILILAVPIVVPAIGGDRMLPGGLIWQLES